MQMPPQPAQPERLTPQQEAIRTVRDRYERGELAFETFKQALDDLLLAQTPEECQNILDALPSPEHVRALQALDGAMAAPRTAAQPPVPATPESGSTTGWLVMLMGELKRTTRRWRLAPRTNCFLMMGEVKLDLNLATLPRQGVLNLFGLMGEITVYVPKTARVRVRATALLGEAKALGESSAGILATTHADSHDEEDFAPGTPEPTSDLTIHAFMCMGEIKVIQTDAPRVRVAEARRAAGREIAGSTRHALQSPAEE